jgi:hypothetical protein
LRDEDGVQFRVKPLPQPQDAEHRIVYGGEVSPKVQNAVFPGATSTNNCSSEQLEHSVPRRFTACSHDDIAVWMTTSSDAIETWLLSFNLR